MKVLIKGAGDLATGIACRLYRCGFTVVMTDVEVPTTVRRTVAFSRAVYEKSAVVEDIKAVLCTDVNEIEEAVAAGLVGVIVDETCEIRHQWKPDALVDAIIAKKNLGTRLSDADIVIGVGPGFNAGVDCHCVVETKRGHNLGRCIWSGSAVPNTGVPGVIGGYASERIIRAENHGIFEGVVSIGDQVQKGDLLAYTGGIPVFAQIQGVVRGILQNGVVVKAGMKSGDIDPRGMEEFCWTISDKASAIGGGVLEGILNEKKKRRE